MYKLKPAVQTYAWGKFGANSEVAQLAASDPSFQIDQETSYAELWMGTHPKAPTMLSDTNQSLAEFMSKHPETIGKELSKIVNKEGEGATLPFLFKVLSVNKALSIQSHPTKEQAIVLHAQDPANYPDSNHKPEMAIALTPFEMLCGFRPAELIAESIQETPELFEMIGSRPFDELSTAIESKDVIGIRVALQACFSQLMHQPEPLMQKNLSSLVERIALSVKAGRAGFSDKTQPKYVLGELILRLNYNFPCDIGCWMPFFLNHFVLQPGEASFLAPNEPHAYLYGDCIECMACSDNTIRAGLTPKFKDVETLVQNLTYRVGTVEENMLQPECIDKNIMLFKTPVPEFFVQQIKIAESGDITLPPLATCAIIIVLSGSAERTDQLTDGQLKTLTRGTIAYQSADTTVTMNVNAPFLAYRAYSPAETLNHLVM